jgi:hypothetical protein
MSSIPSSGTETRQEAVRTGAPPRAARGRRPARPGDVARDLWTLLDRDLPNGALLDLRAD